MTTPTEKLTKFSSSTILTSDFANSLYGGLYGSGESIYLSSDDSRVVGHVHDGQHLDGHASKINLVTHVTGKLTNTNLADSAVQKNNIASFLDQGNAIPESIEIDGVTRYLLDLSDIRSTIDPESYSFKTVANTIMQYSSDLSSTGPDFIVGSSQVDDLDEDGDGDSRIFFKKDESSFRAGIVTDDSWDKRGSYSAAFGFNNKAYGDGSFVSGSLNILGDDAIDSAAFGQGNYVYSETSLVVGLDNSASDTAHNSFVTGSGNRADKESSVVIGSGGRARSINGEFVQSGDSFVEQGDAQISRFTLMRSIQKSVSPYFSQPLYHNGDTSTGENYQIDTFCSYLVKADIIGKVYGSQNTAAFNLVYIIEKQAEGSAANVTPSTKTIYYQSSNLLLTDAEVDVSDDKIRIKVSDSNLGLSGNINWFASVEILKVKFA
jgi:hypothetical protein